MPDHTPRPGGARTPAGPVPTGPPGASTAPDQGCPAAGPSRLFALLYGVFAVGATSRAGVQLATRMSEAPLAYTLSAVSAAVYVVGFVLLLRWGHPGSRRALRVLCLLELAGVLVVGTLSLARPDFFPDASVWSDFGMGYLFLPVVLPVLVLRWLRRTA